MIAQIRSLDPGPWWSPWDQGEGPFVRVRRGATVLPGNMELAHSGVRWSWPRSRVPNRPQSPRSESTEHWLQS